jgi:DNA-binding FadR family transcriptional regulator
LPLPGRPQKVLEEHARIFEAIHSHDAVAAKHAMQTHLTNVIKDLDAEHARENSPAPSPFNSEQEREHT